MSNISQSPSLLVPLLAKNLISFYSIISTENGTRKDGIDMIAMNYSTLRSHMKYAFDACCDDMETLIVTRKDNRNVVVLSEESYNNLMENLYVRASKKNYDRLLTSIAQAKAGQCKKRDLIEDE